jgi:hypothetical protein
MSRLVAVSLSLGLFALAGAPLVSAPAPAAPAVPKELLQERLEAARQTYKQTWQRLKGGDAHPTDLPAWSRRWLDAELALCEKKADRIAAHQAHLDRMKEVEQFMHRIVKAGMAVQADATAATYFRTEAEIGLIQAGGKLPPRDKPAAEKGEALSPPRPEK